MYLLVISYAHKSPGNYWYGEKWFYLPKTPGEEPQGMLFSFDIQSFWLRSPFLNSTACPTNLMRSGAKFINQDGQADTISIECVEDYSIQ